MARHLGSCGSAPTQIKLLFKHETSECSKASSLEVKVKESDKLENSNCSQPKNPLTLTNFCDRMTLLEKKQIDAALARATYATFMGFSMIENKYFKEFLKTIRPSYQAPSRYLLGNTLLGKLLCCLLTLIIQYSFDHFPDEEYGRIDKLVKEKIKQAECMCILSDGWTDVNKEIL